MKEERLQQDPEYATYIGDSRYNDQLTDVSLQGLHKWNEKQKAFLQELKSFINNNSLLPEDSGLVFFISLHRASPWALDSVSSPFHVCLFLFTVNAQLLEDILDKSIRLFEANAHLMPLTQFKGIQLGLLSAPPPPTDWHFEGKSELFWSLLYSRLTKDCWYHSI